MARETSITIDCSRYSDRIIDVISLLNEIGWKYYNNSNQIEFLPIGDNDNFNWLKKVYQ